MLCGDDVLDLLNVTGNDTIFIFFIISPDDAQLYHNKNSDTWGKLLLECVTCHRTNYCGHPCSQNSINEPKTGQLFVRGS
jgi:radical SAM protein with 4Fe4S-binding SPASM domain